MYKNAISNCTHIYIFTFVSIYLLMYEFVRREHLLGVRKDYLMAGVRKNYAPGFRNEYLLGAISPAVNDLSDLICVLGK